MRLNNPLRSGRKFASSSPSLSVTTINGKKFVVDLYWHQLSSIRAYMKEARKVGDQKDYDIVAIRKSATQIQAGFVRRDSNIEKGMYSLASALAGLLGDGWCGAFKLPDGRYAICAVRNHQVIPGFDRLATDAETAKEIYRSAVSWFDDPKDRFFAPKDWGEPAEDLSISDLLKVKALQKSFKLQQLKLGMTPKEVKVLAAGVTALALVCGGAWAVKKHYDDIALAAQIKEAARRAEELDRINETARNKLVMEALAHPWSKQPTPADFLSACETSLGALPLSIAGWLLTSGQCTGTQALARYTRQEGATQMQFQTGAEQFAQLPVAFENANVGTIAVGLQLPAGGDDPVIDANAAQRTLVSRFQEQDPVDATLSVVQREVVIKMPPPPPGVPVKANEKPPAATWREFSVDLKNIGLPASTFLGPVTSLPGLRLTSLNFALQPDSAQLTWSLNGTLYAQK